MPIKYDSEYNKRIAKDVKNFNAKRKRAIARGYKNVPEHLKVSELKSRYTTKKAMESQLRQLRRFTQNRGYDVLKKVEKQGGAEAIKWEWNYLKSNVKLAKEFYQRQYDLLASKVGEFPGERMQLDAIAAKLQTLDLDVRYMDQSQFNSFRAAIRGFMNYPKKLKAGYRGFLSEVDLVMTMVGIDEERKKKFFNKVNTLYPEQFNYLYQKSDLISRIYELADSPIYTGGELKLNTTVDIAEDLIETLLEETDELVKEAKEKMPKV